MKQYVVITVLSLLLLGFGGCIVVCWEDHGQGLNSKVACAAAFEDGHEICVEQPEAARNEQ